MGGVQRTRTRAKSVWSDTGKYGQKYTADTQYTANIIEFQQTLDETRHGWRTNPPPTWDGGGPFLSSHYTGRPLSPWWGSTADLFQGRWFEGTFLPSLTVYDGSSAARRANAPGWVDSHPEFNSRISSDQQLDAAGTTAISRCAPTNPHASVYTMIGELRRDGIPALAGLDTFRKRGKPKELPSTIGGEYLNVEFGIKPLLSDLRKLAKALKESERILKQYQRDAGRVVRREYEIPSRPIWSETVRSTGFALSPSLDSYYWDSMACNNVRTTTIEIRRWFSGAFMYRIPDLEGPMGVVLEATAKMNHLLGIEPTPAALWNLTPWTWAADWFTNMGDVVNNASMFLTDGLILRYGYVMEEITMTHQYSSYGPVLKKAGTVSTSIELALKRKRRRRATPFGFGLTEGSFTPRQWAIIAALGLSQGGRYVAK